MLCCAENPETQIGVADPTGLTTCLLNCEVLLAGVFPRPPSDKELVFGHLLLKAGSNRSWVCKSGFMSLCGMLTCYGIQAVKVFEIIGVSIREAINKLEFMEVPWQVRVDFVSTMTRCEVSR